MTITGIYEVEGHRDVHLIEMMIDEPPEKVDVGQITQEIQKYRLKTVWIANPHGMRDI